MDGYSVKDAASVLGIPKRRVWELIARGVLSGAPEGDGGMRVFLQPRPRQPSPLSAATEEPTRTNGNGGGHPDPSREASPFREILTEFRSLTERYGQALLALGEARGEVAALRSRVELLEARLDLRLPGPRQSSTVAWDMAQYAPPMPEPPAAEAATAPGGAPAEAPVAADLTEPPEAAASVEAEEPFLAQAAPLPEVPGPEDAAVNTVAGEAALDAGGAEARAAADAEASPPVAAPERPRRDKGASRRRRSLRSHSALTGIAEALARAQDPTLADLPGAREAAEALAALQREVEARSVTGGPDAAAEPQSVADDMAELEPSAVAEVVPELEPEIAAAPVAELEAEAATEAVADEAEAAASSVEPGVVEDSFVEPAVATLVHELGGAEASPREAPPEVAAAPSEAPTDAPSSHYTTDVVEPDWFADGDFNWLEGIQADSATADETERLEAERLEAERVEAERLEAEEAARLEAERVEAERLEAERLEAERVEAERLEAERVEAEEVARLEAERLEAERLEAERGEAERLEAERLEAERLEAERLEAEEAARLEAERVDAERLEAEEAARLEAERADAERLEAEEAARLEAERLEAERLEAERLEAERLEAEEAARLEAERLEAERLEAERLEAEPTREPEGEQRDSTDAEAGPAAEAIQDAFEAGADAIPEPESARVATLQQESEPTEGAASDAIQEAYETPSPDPTDRPTDTPPPATVATTEAAFAPLHMAIASKDQPEPEASGEPDIASGTTPEARSAAGAPEAVESPSTPERPRRLTFRAAVQPTARSTAHPTPAPVTEGSAEEELMWLGDEFEAAGLEVATPGWRSEPEASVLPRVAAVHEMSDADLAQLAQDEGWDLDEVDAIRTLLGRSPASQPTPHALAIPVEASALPDDVHPMQEIEPAVVEPQEAAPVQSEPTPPPDGRFVEPMSTEPLLSEAPAADVTEVERLVAETTVDEPPATEAPPPPELRSGATEPDWLRRRRGPAATAYRRLRRLLPG